MDERRTSFERPPDRHGGEVMSPTLPLPPPKDSESLERFVEWVAMAPRAHREKIREVIGGLRWRAQVAELLHNELFALPCADVGRHGLLLSITGELGEPSSVEVLERFVWLSDAELFGPALRREYGPCDCAPSGMLQARAAEMLVWLVRKEREEAVLRVVREHPLTTVRVAAIDAYLFQRDDTPEEVAALAERVRPEDAWAVGLPRRFDGMDVEQFDRAVAEHEARHGGETQRPRQRGGGPDVH